MIMPDHLQDEFLEFIDNQIGPKDNYDWIRLIQLAFVAGHSAALRKSNEALKRVINPDYKKDAL